MSFFKQKKNSGKHGYSSFSKSNKKPKISFNHLDDTITLSFDEEIEDPISVSKPIIQKVPVKEIVRPTIKPSVEKIESNFDSLKYSDINKIITTKDTTTHTNTITNVAVTPTTNTITNASRNASTNTTITEDITEENKEKTYPIFDGNDTLLISERESKVLLPYSKKDIDTYLYEFSDKYTSAKEVIDNEFTYSLKYFSNFSRAARFREAFALYKDREGKTTFESLAFAFKTMKISNLQPAIIAACRSERVFKDYLDHLNNNDLENFKYFKIEYKLSPSIR